MNEHEAERIAAAGHQLRPDWPVSSLRTLIRKNLMDRPRRDVAVALAWVACEAGTSTPARVLESGPWWRAAGVEGATAMRKGGPICVHCGNERPECERRWQGDHEFEEPNAWMRRRLPPEDVHEVVQSMKQDIACEEPKAPAEREHKPSPNVDRLRHLAETAAEDPRPTPPARDHKPSEGRARVAAGNETTEAATAAESETA